MRRAEFEKRLRAALQAPTAAAPAGLSRRLAEEASRRRPHISFLRFLVRQARWIGLRVWGLQGGFLLLAVALFGRLYGPDFSAYAMLRLLFSLSVFVAMAALPFLYRVARYRMQEIEGASYFSSAKLLLARLIIIGIGDAALLAGIFLAAVAKTALPAGSVSLYLVLPFLAMSGGCLYLLAHCRLREFLMGSLALGGLLLLLGVLLPGRLTALLALRLDGVWLLVCMGLLAFSAGQLRRILAGPYCAEQQV